jgi:hypothetical protein
MARDILSEYDPSGPMGSDARCGGILPGMVRDIPYKPPSGPKGINDPKTPGISGGVNSGTGQQPTQLQRGGAPGDPGYTNRGNSGSQGRY